jgi:hypothetical protein
MEDPMKRLSIALILVFISAIVFGCNTEESSDETNVQSVDLERQDQLQLISSSLSSGSGGVGDNLGEVSQAANGQAENRDGMKHLTASLNISVEVDYYDAQDNLQSGYYSDTTDRIDYESLISGEIKDSNGYFRDLTVDNRSDFSVTDILSGIVTIDGTHTNFSSYTRNQQFPPAEVNFEMDGESVLTAVTVDLDASDDFPESGTLEGTFSGLLEKIGVGWSEVKEFDFHFVCTYTGDNTAEIVLDDGTTWTIHLDTGEVEEQES